MARIHVVSPDKTRKAGLPPDCAGDGDVRSYLAASDFPLRLDECRLGPGAGLTIGPVSVECIGYVWHGSASAGGHRLDAGSSFIVEKGQELAVTATEAGCTILLFAASSPHPATGGHVHILPNERVPRDNEINVWGVSGGMHADSACETCDIWLHENGFPAGQPKSHAEAALGVHSHSEDEIIFIVSGQIRLGRKLFPEGTAIAIPGDTLYTFTPGPEGMRFINFRAAMPSVIHFANGETMDETGYWRDKLPRPEYLDPR